jgi:hypothetical protein
MNQSSLNSAVKLYFPPGNEDGPSLLSRVSLSAGTVEAVSLGLPYAKHSRISASKWRPPTHVESENLLTSSPLPRGYCVALCRLLEESEIAQVQEDLRTVRTQFGNPRQLNESLLDLVISSLKYKCRTYDISNVLGINIDAGNLETTSINRTTGLFAGLHVDVWENRLIEERHLSANRISINLGPSHRYFLFVRMSVAEMKFALKDPSIGSDLDSLTHVERHFLEKYPDFPVTRLRIEPGEAYFAPTENLIHDGSTSDCPSPPFTFALQGIFEF